MKHLGSKEFDLPSWNGESGYKYRLFRTKLIWIKAATAENKLEILAPKVIERFTGPVAKLFEDADPNHYRHAEGIDRLVEFLDQKFGEATDVELTTSIRSFFYKMRKTHHETFAAFSARFRTSYEKVEKLVVMELQKDARKALAAKQEAYRLLYLEYQDKLRVYNVESPIANAAMAVLRAQLTIAEAADPIDEAVVRDLQRQVNEVVVPEAPTVPTPPTPEDPPKFVFPPVLLGSLYLMMSSISVDVQQNLIRNAHGSTNLETIERLLKSSEQASSSIRDRNTKYDTYPAQDIPEEEYLDDEDEYKEEEVDDWEEEGDGYYGEE